MISGVTYPPTQRTKLKKEMKKKKKNEEKLKKIQEIEKKLGNTFFFPTRGSESSYTSAFDCMMSNYVALYYFKKTNKQIINQLSVTNQSNSFTQPIYTLESFPVICMINQENESIFYAPNLKEEKCRFLLLELNEYHLPTCNACHVMLQSKYVPYCLLLHPKKLILSIVTMTNFCQNNIQK